MRRILWALLLISVVSLANISSAAALRFGDSGEAVREIQDYLIAQSLLESSAADGVYNSSTVTAIKDFQEALGLEVDGVCGALTYKLLRAAAYDEIDVNTFRLGDYVPEHVDTPAPVETISLEPVVEEVAPYAGVGDVIKLGMEGDGVAHLQDKLFELGYYDGESDGVAGVSTISALKAFQRTNGMTPDGVCGRNTYSALDDALNTNYEPAPVEEYNFDVPRYGRVVRVEATAYSSMEDGMGAYTATGTLCRRGVIATDPNFIPLGTKVFIPGYGYAVAEDTGGAIIGNIIDVAFDTVGECYEWGRQYIDIYIIE